MDANFDHETEGYAWAKLVAHNILSALEHMHSRNFIHTDVKPANIFLRGDMHVAFEIVLGDLGSAEEARSANMRENSKILRCTRALLTCCHRATQQERESIVVERPCGEQGAKAPRGNRMCRH